MTLNWICFNSGSTLPKHFSIGRGGVQCILGAVVCLNRPLSCFSFLSFLVPSLLLLHSVFFVPLCLFFILSSPFSTISLVHFPPYLTSLPFFPFFPSFHILSSSPPLSFLRPLPHSFKSSFQPSCLLSFFSYLLSLSPSCSSSSPSPPLSVRNAVMCFGLRSHTHKFIPTCLLLWWKNGRRSSLLRKHTECTFKDKSRPCVCDVRTGVNPRDSRCECVSGSWIPCSLFWSAASPLWLKKAEGQRKWGIISRRSKKCVTDTLDTVTLYILCALTVNF